MERHFRTLQGAGVANIAVVVEDPLVELEVARAKPRGVELETLAAPTGLGEWLGRVSEAQAQVLVIDMSYLVDPVLVRTALSATETTILVDTDPPGPARDGAHRLIEFSDHEGPSTDPGLQAYFCGLVYLADDGTLAAQLAGVGSMHELVAYLLQRPWRVRKLDVAGLPTFQSDIRRKRRPVWMHCYNRDQMDMAKR
ncbi:MAG: hypothetical protein OEQ18_11760, partial [Gammaproteobacteria bacterium]|nr:hypothetical protein [Gammaproteobacteria bacterium]